MADSFQSISGLIEVDLKWRTPNPSVLRHPAVHAPQDSRIVFHETVHYWQQLGQGFLVKMTEEEWNQLQKFESDGTVDNLGVYRLEYHREDKQTGFSAQDLHESLARFWDVHVIGPHRLIEMDFANPKRHFDEAFKAKYFGLKAKGMIIHPQHGGYSDLAYDLAMEASAGSYAKPYLYVRELCNPVVTGTVFPLAGYFAMQTERPVDVFLRIIEEIVPDLIRLPKNQAIEDLWRMCYPLVRKRALRVTQEFGLGTLLITGELLEKGALDGHPVYQWIFEDMERALENLRHLMTFVSMPIDISFDYILTCPGDVSNRSFLIDNLAPLCVRFADGKKWFLSDFYRREIVPNFNDFELELSEKRKQAVAHAVDIQERWLTFLRAQPPG